MNTKPKNKPAPARNQLDYYHNANKLSLSIGKEIKDSIKIASCDPTKCPSCGFALTERNVPFGPDDFEMEIICETCGWYE